MRLGRHASVRSVPGPCTPNSGFASPAIGVGRDLAQARGRVVGLFSVRLRVKSKGLGLPTRETRAIQGGGA